MSIITNYSPNIDRGVVDVEIVLKAWDYTKTFVIQVDGSFRGFGLLEQAIEQLYDDLPNDMPSVVLTRPDGDTLLCEDEEDRGPDWLKKMCVSAAVTGWTAPTLNEVRASNGAAPLPEGDRPWYPG